MSEANMIFVRGLTARLAGRTVLDRVDLTIGAGRLTALLGPNGAGKTTLLKHLAGLKRPAAGAVSLGTQCVAAMSARERARQIAYVPQHIPAGLPLTVREFVGLGRAPYLGAFSRLSSTDRQMIESALETTELQHLAEHRLDGLSGGERQRAAIARALAQDSPVLLLDEPTNHLDLRHQHRLQQLLVRLAASGKTVIEVLHDLNLAANYANELALFEHGRLVAAGKVDRVLRGDILSRVYQWPLAMQGESGHWQLQVMPA